MTKSLVASLLSYPYCCRESNFHLIINRYSIVWGAGGVSLHTFVRFGKLHLFTMELSCTIHDFQVSFKQEFCIFSVPNPQLNLISIFTGLQILLDVHKWVKYLYVLWYNFHSISITKAKALRCAHLRNIIFAFTFHLLIQQTLLFIYFVWSTTPGAKKYNDK